MKEHLDEESAKATLSKVGAESLSSYIERSVDLITVVDLEGRFLYVNPASERFFGVPPADCEGRQAFDFVHADDVESTRAALGTWLEKRETSAETHENRQVNATTGEVFHVLWTIVPELDEEGLPCKFTSIARDITELRRVERELTSKELYLRSIFAGMLDAVVTIDPIGTIVDASTSCFDVFGYPSDELVGKNVSMLMPEPHRSSHDDYLARYRETGETWILNTTRRFECVHASGKAIICELAVSRIDIPGGGVFFCGSFRDVTERVRTESILAENERRFRAVFDQEFQYVGMLAPDGTLFEVNQAALEVIGADRAEVIGTPFWETRWWEHSEDERVRLREAVEAAARGELTRFEARVVTPDGDRRSVDFSVKPVIDEAGEVVLLVAEGRDITAMKRAQERETSMLRAFASIGESASVLAHEIKNPITAVNAALRAVAKELGEDEKEILEELVGRMQKLERLIRRTLTFAKPLEVRVRRVDVAELFAEISGMLADELEEKGVTLETSCEEACPLVVADGDLLEEVLLNLARNAMEAGARTVKLSEQRVDNDFVCMAVDDDGSGIAPSILTSMFAPFVTTKETGTGIGLAISKKIVEQHGGRIRAGASELGGARFEVTLPASPG